MVKKLRYYARYIVVCLLLKKMKLVRDLVRVSNQAAIAEHVSITAEGRLHAIACSFHSGVSQADRWLHRHLWTRGSVGVVASAGGNTRIYRGEKASRSSKVLEQSWVTA